MLLPSIVDVDAIMDFLWVHSPSFFRLLRGKMPQEELPRLQEERNPMGWFAGARSAREKLTLYCGNTGTRSCIWHREGEGKGFSATNIRGECPRGLAYHWLCYNFRPTLISCQMPSKGLFNAPMSLAGVQR